MIHRYRLDQCQIIASQYSVLNTLHMVFNEVKMNGLSYTHAINAVCVTSPDHLINCLNMRKYLKMVFAPTEALLIPSENLESDEGGVCE